MVTVYEDYKECRFYFPHFKDILKFKGIVKAEAEENQVRKFYRLLSFCFPAKTIMIARGLDTNIYTSLP